MTLTVPASYYAVGILDQSQRDRAYRLALDIAAHIDAGRWSNATAARSVLFDYIDGANGPNTAPNVDSILKYGEYDESGISAFLNSAETKRSSLNLPADATWRQSSSIVHEHLYEDIMKPYSALLEPVLAAGVPVLLYQANSTSATASPRRRLARELSWTGRRRFLDSPRKAEVFGDRWLLPELRRPDAPDRSNAAGHLVPHDAPSLAHPHDEALGRAPSRNNVNVYTF